MGNNSRKLLFSLILAALATSVWAQRHNQPASDVLLHEDLWGNPTFIGGVTNGGANATGLA